MLMLEEFKKNIKFFVLMTLVLTLLMSAGVSLFNFSFEINKKIYESINEYFDNGYEIDIEGFKQNTDELRRNGVSYATYSQSGKYIAGLDEAWLDSAVYQFEDYLHKAFERGLNNYNDFIIAGSLWTATDNGQNDDKYPIFLSDSIVSQARENGFDISIGSIIGLFERIYEGNGEIIIGEPQYTESEIREFYVKGIYRKSGLPNDFNIPESVISIAAEQDFRQDSYQEIDNTNFVLNSVIEFKRFAAYARNTGLNYSADIEEDMEMIKLFSGIIITVSIVILILCGIIAFVYFGMFINKRLNFIGLIKALGMSDFRISKQFFVLLLLIFGVSFLFGNVFSVLISSHFTNLVLTLFEFNLNISFNILSQGIFAIFTILMALVSVILLHKRIKKISISQTLTQRE